MRRREQIIDGDAQSAIGYLVAKQDRNPLLFQKYYMGDKGKMRRLFWANSKSRIDYEKFGDVLVFDMIYQTNVHRKLLMVLVGINNYFMTCIFACAILSDKTVETYEWVLDMFLKAI